MWVRLARIILRYRISILIIIGIITAYMGYRAFEVHMSYTYAQMLPESDTTFIEYNYFKSIFGEEASGFVVGVKDPDLFQKDRFNDYLDLIKKTNNQYGIQNVMSVGQTINIIKNDSTQHFEFTPLFPEYIQTQEELDSLTDIFKDLLFYKGLLYNDTANVYLISIALDKALLNTKERVDIVNNVHQIFEEFAQEHEVRFYYSGLPYIRTETSKMVKNELIMFIFLAIIVTSIIIYVFFRSFNAVFFSMLIVGIGVIWSIGTIALFGYEITILTGMVPPLLIVIGVPNTIFMLNKYHAEFKKHGNKIKSLQRVISEIGNAIFLTNLTTAAGFATFILTSSSILIEFGVVASLNILGLFILAITLIPSIFSFLPPPKRKHVKHLDNKWTSKIILILESIVINHRKKVYMVLCLLMIFAIYGISKMETTGYMVDDLPHDDPIYTDLKFFEEKFNGVMPVEILIDTKEPQGALKLETIKRLDSLQNALTKYPELSKAYSLAEASKFLRQALYNGDVRRYRIPIERERITIAKYLDLGDNHNRNLISSYLDTSSQITRLSVMMLDVGTKEMKIIKPNIKRDIEQYFPNDKYPTVITGTSIVSSKGTDYLISNLFVSLAIAITFISLLMFVMFKNWRVVCIGLIPNLIPQIMTAALIGYFGISIKPSTVLIFSIAFGISVDNTIHFLTRFQQILKSQSWSINKSIIMTLRERGVSMMYTGIILFCGFSIFAASEFQGTQSLGILVSLMLLFAMFANLIVLPSLLLTFEKTIVKSLSKRYNKIIINNPILIQKDIHNQYHSNE